MNDCLVTYIEKNIFKTIKCEEIMTYIHDMQSIEEFSAFRGIGQLVEKMVEMKKNVSYPLIYSLVILTLILLVAIATVERAFSTMNVIKNRLRNQIGD